MTSARAIAAWLVIVIGCAIIIARTEISTDISAFLPRSPSPAQQVLVEQLREGVAARLILIGIEGGAPETLADISRRMAAELRGRNEFASIDNGEDISDGKDRDFLWRNRYLLSPAVAPERFSLAGLRTALEEDLRLLGSPAGMLLQRILPADPTGELLHLVESFDAGAKPTTRNAVWFAPSTDRALLVAQTRAAGSDIDAQERALSAITAAFSRASASSTAAANARLLLAGPGVFSVNTRERVKGDALRFSIIATVLVGAMLLALYRSVRVLILGLLPVVSGALAGIAAVSLSFGSVHGITLGFGATLIGEGVDYAIYLFAQTERGAPQLTLRRIWPTLRLGVVTSICGFSAMVLSGFPGLAQLGVFSIVGLLVAVSVTRWILPSLMPRAFEVPAVNTLGPVIGKLVRHARRARYAALALVVIALAAIGLHRQPIWSDDLASLSPISAGEARLDMELRRDLGAPDVRHIVVVMANDAQAVLEAAESIGTRLQQAIETEALAGFDSPAAYLPSVAAQRIRQSALPEPEALRERLRVASAGLPFQPDLFEPFVRDVATARAQPLLDRSRVAETRFGLKVDTLLVKRPNGWAALLPLRGVKDASAIAQQIGTIAGAQVVVLDLKRESNALYSAYRREAQGHALLGLAAIVVMLSIALRSVRRVALVMLPLAAACAVCAAVILLTGTSLTIFHLVGLLLVVAVGSNYSLFFDRAPSGEDDRERTVVSLLFANISTVIGFGLLAFSKVPVLHAIGFTVAFGAALSLVFSAVFIGPRNASTGDSALS